MVDTSLFSIEHVFDLVKTTRSISTPTVVP